jgi:hypothetical protein
MHDWVGVASDGFADIFRIAEEAAGFQFRGANVSRCEPEQGLSNAARAKGSYYRRFE